MDLLKSSQNKRKLSELFSASTKPETAWKLFKAVFDLSPSGKAQLSRDELKSSWTMENTQRVLSSLKNTVTCTFWKGKTAETPIKRRWWKHMPRATKEELEWAYVLTREKFLVRVNKLSPIRALDWNRYLDVIFESILKRMRRQSMSQRWTPTSKKL